MASVHVWYVHLQHALRPASTCDLQQCAQNLNSADQRCAEFVCIHCRPLNKLTDFVLLCVFVKLQACNAWCGVCLGPGVWHGQDCLSTSTVIPWHNCLCVIALHCGNNGAHPQRCSKEGEFHLHIWPRNHQWPHSNARICGFVGDRVLFWRTNHSTFLRPVEVSFVAFPVPHSQLQLPLALKSIHSCNSG